MTVAEAKANGLAIRKDATGRYYRLPRRVPSRPPRIDTGFHSRVPQGLKKAVGYVDAHLYDCTSPISGATEDTFFQVAIGGQLSGSATVKKTLLHTNMKQSGQLPADERFEVHGYAMWLTPLGLKDTTGALPVTLVNAMFDAYVVIKFRGYRDLNYPLTALLTSNSPSVALEDGLYWLQQGSPFTSYPGYKKLTKPIILSRSVPVEVKVEWAAAPTAAEVDTNATLLYFTFIGIKEFAVVS